jgi:ribonuclease HI
MLFDPYALQVFIDGSALKNPGGPGGIAAVVQYPDSWNLQDECIFEVGYVSTTNNRMELLALITALEYLRRQLHKPTTGSTRSDRYRFKISL